MHLRKPAKPTLFRKFKLLFISMASFFTLTIFSLILFFSISSAARHHSSTSPSISLQIRGACKASRDPPTCESVLTDSGNLPSELTTSLIIQSAVKVSSKNNDKAKEMVQAIIDASAGNNQNRTDAGKVCMEVLGYAEYRVGLTGQAVINGGYKSARAWMSSVMVYQYDCWSALKYVNGTSQVSKTMSFINSLIGYSSNALGMMVNFDLYGADTGSWTIPKTERDGFWEGSGSGSSGSGHVKGGVPTGLKPDVTVCKEGGCDYKTVQEAVNAAPEKEQTRKFVIWIKSGLYEEKVRVGLEKMNVVFLGDGMGKTIITGSLSVGLAGVTTYETATVGVVGDGFMASGITFQNTAGPDAHQAVAFRSDSDLSVVENCEFIGNQDTLYAHALRQYYKSCRIQGNVDFIFGNSASFFQDCDILIAPRQLRPEKGETNAVTAHGRIDPAQSTGFVFQNCLINGTDKYMTLYYNKPKVHKNFLGRPWKEYSRTVFLDCTLEALISPNGWLPWSGDFALKTLYYGEYRNTGAGANTAGRVSWSSQIPDEHVNSYSIQNFIQGDQWISTSS